MSAATRHNTGWQELNPAPKHQASQSRDVIKVAGSVERKPRLTLPPWQISSSIFWRQKEEFAGSLWWSYLGTGVRRPGCARSWIRICF